MTSSRESVALGRRRSGILLPMAALCTDTGGALGAPARRFLDFLCNAGFGFWQMLPIHPPDTYGCPYQSGSVHAGDTRLIGEGDEQSAPWMRASTFDDFRRHAGPEDLQDYAEFRQRQAAWLDDFALFLAIKHGCGERPWWEWSPELRDRDAEAIAAFRVREAPVIEGHCCRQYLFFRQWRELRREAAARGLLLIGDVPLFPAHDSADVWVHRNCFQLHAAGQPVVLAGVPPDRYSATGQRWGNPVYDWLRLSKDGFRWWIDRMRTELQLFDLLRLDHFRGLQAVWEIPAVDPTAQFGQWRPAPGRELLDALRAELGSLPLIAEDLGLITAEVHALRREADVPGMKVLQFAFDSDSTNPYLPHNHEPGFVVYTGTHDNNTTLGWYEDLDPGGRKRVLEYLGSPQEPMPWPLIRAALASVCQTAVLPMQDVLSLDASHRINIPGTLNANWRWRLNWDRVNPELAARLRDLNFLYGRA